MILVGHVKEILIMTEQDKQLLFKDLCTRLPYEVKLDNGLKLRSMDALTQIVSCSGSDRKVENVRPYLRPMSSMAKMWGGLNEQEIKNPFILFDSPLNALDYFLENHIDFRGLIPAGLALEAPDNIYKTE